MSIALHTLPVIIRSMAFPMDSLTFAARTHDVAHASADIIISSASFGENGISAIAPVIYKPCSSESLFLSRAVSLFMSTCLFSRGALSLTGCSSISMSLSKLPFSEPKVSRFWSFFLLSFGFLCCVG